MAQPEAPEGERDSMFMLYELLEDEFLTVITNFCSNMMAFLVNQRVADLWFAWERGVFQGVGLSS